MPDFLLEIGCEELPAGYILPALEAFEKAFAGALESEGLAFEGLESTATPRRLVFFASGLPEKAEERVEEKSGPSVAIAVDPTGAATSAAVGFAKSQGGTIGDLKVRHLYIFEDLADAQRIELRKEKSRVTFDKRIAAKETVAILAEALPGLIKAIPFPKSMYWRDPAVRFARPIRRILALFGDKVVEFEVNGVASGRVSEGHPFLAGGGIEVPCADLDALKEILRKAFVIVDRRERRSKILAELTEALAAHGGKLGEQELLEEVTDLVEWPEVLEGKFAEDYLALPEEVVAAAMMDHQRYFPVRDGSGRLVNRFLTVANRSRPYCDGIREGNERVLAARLYDARFFWEADRGKSLEQFAGALDGVVYLAGLGTLADKVERMKKLAAFAAEAAGAPEHSAAAIEACALAKADLLTEMVGEFPSLQGVMGRAYALAEGKPEEVARAIEEHYLPRTLAGRLPATPAGQLAALADKADTLAGAFAMGVIPSGSQDPYGLRRASVGIIRIIVESGLHISLPGLLEKAWGLVGEFASGAPKGDFAALTDFVRDRLYQYYLDRGLRHDILRACLAAGFDNLADLDERLRVITAVSAEDFWADLVTAVERTFNITKNYSGPDEIDPSLFTEDEERALFEVYGREGARIEELTAAGDYAGASRAFAEAFAVPLHTFFDKVFVNVDDERVRSNRLAMIRAINRLYSGRVADLSVIIQE